MDITKNIKYIGVNDKEIDLFESQYVVPNGMSYNSYVILDEKVACFDTVDARFKDMWLENLKTALGDRKPDYLVVLHMEPDHSSNIANFADEYPDAKIVSSAKAFSMMKGFFGNEFEDRQIVVGEGDVLELGKHCLTFITAPMVHWPEVLLAYESTEKILFSADAFGKFGALDVKDDWKEEARRYYFGIVGKYGAQVQAVLKKAAAIDIKTICPLHGPALTENISHYLNLYNTWSSYEPETEGVMIAYTSVYGNTRKACQLLCDKLNTKGYEVVIRDLARCDMSQCVAEAFKYSKLVLATTTYNADIFPHMRTFIEELAERNFKNRKVALIENGSWAPMATKIMRSKLDGLKTIDVVESTVKITSALDERSLAELDELSKQI